MPERLKVAERWGRGPRIAGVALAAVLAAGGIAWRAHAAGILTQGSNPGLAAASAVSAAVSAQLTQQQQANQVALQATNQLSRITNALNAMTAAQSAARAAAQGAASTVPDGLQTGGLVPTETAAQALDWQGANAPTQSVAAGKTTVTIDQTAKQALLNWNSFNVGKHTELDFNQQGNSNWVALNKVASGVAPSQILGAIKASGQVYIINANGIIFGGASQINVGSLVAASADISTDQFYNNGIYSTQTGSIYNPSFTGAQGAITVAPGAEISTNAPASSTIRGGYVLMLGTQVTNGGSIVTPNGQAELAAGDDFIIRSGYSTSSNATSTTRGNEIAVQLTPGSGRGLVENQKDALIYAATGDITLAGETVVQNGVALSTSSVAARGTIHLLSSATDKSSSVTLGADGMTLILPQTESTAAILPGTDAAGTELDSQYQAAIAASAIENAARSTAFNAQFDDLSRLDDQQGESRIEIVTGGSVEFAGGSDTSAQGGQIAVQAAGRVQVDGNAELDVSGSYGVAMSMASNAIQVDIQNNELRDNPQNRLADKINNTTLSTVYVDARTLSLVPASSADSADRYYTAGGLLEVSGYLANVAHTIGEYTALGGSIDIATGSKGSIVAQSGSDFDIDGGTLQYAGGEMPQSYLIGSDGKLYDVNTAPPDITYTGIYNGYSVGSIWTKSPDIYQDTLRAPSQVYEAGYTEGRSAGTLTLSSPTTVFNGTLHANAVDGQNQIQADPAGIASLYALTQSEVAQGGVLDIESLSNETAAATMSDVIFEATKAKNIGLGKSPGKLKGETLLDTQVLDKSGLGTIQVVTDGSIAVQSALDVAAGGAVDLYGSSVDIAADITAPGGAVNAGQIATVNGKALSLTAPKGHHPADGNTLVEKNVVISTAGLWTNLLLDPQLTYTQAFINGGAVDLGSVNSLKLQKGSVIDTSSGGVVGRTGAVSGGSGGNITLAAATTGDQINTAAGKLILRGTLDGMGYTGGGALTLQGQAFMVTNRPPANDNSVVTLSPAFFAQGFSAYDLLSLGSIKVAGNAKVDVTEPTYQIDAATLLTPSGAAPAAAFGVGLDPLYAPNSKYTAITQRPGASFSADIYTQAAASTPSPINGINLTVAGAITVDPGQAINLAATGQITIKGDLTAPGGTISAISAFNTDAALPDGPGTVSVFVGDHATLDASAAAVSFRNALGDIISEAPSGGTITLGSNTSTASVIITKGSTLEASGSHAKDVAAGAKLSQGETVALQGNGGTISLASDEGLYNAGTLVARAGGPDAAGGTLAMTLEADKVLNASGLEATSRIFTITQSEQPAGLPGKLAPGSSHNLTIGTAELSQQQINQGGFGTVDLYTRDAFLFQGNVKLSAAQSITLSQGVIADSSPTGSVTLTAPLVRLSGQTPDNNINFSPLAVISGYYSGGATGKFTVNAGTIELNNQVAFGGVLNATTADPTELPDFRTVNLKSSGDIIFTTATDQGVGTVTDLITTADLNLTAREIYATGENASTVAGGGNSAITSAATSALIVAGYDPTLSADTGNLSPTGTLDIYQAARTSASAPDTLAGSLQFVAATINQAGSIWQPLGKITFGNINNDSSAFGKFSYTGDPLGTVNFRSGSITSVSAAGLNIPYGGTTDGINYSVDGNAVSIAAILNGSLGYSLAGVNNGQSPGTVNIEALKTHIAAGAKIDLSGGGNLTGAGFISGEGGSVDVLSNPLLEVSSSGVVQPSLATHQVYAIVAGSQQTLAEAYTEGTDDESATAIGQQIVIPAGVPGLPAGTYTLLPASYALEPGGYRVEFDGAAALGSAPVTTLANGSYAVAGYTATANTDVRSTLASDLTITPGSTVTNYAQYDQQSYGSFLLSDAATLGETRPVLPEDGGTLDLTVPISSNVSVIDNGTASFAAVDGGLGGTLQIAGANATGSEPSIVFYGKAPVAGEPDGTVQLSAAEIDAFDPTTLEVGAAGQGGGAKVTGITLAKGATLRAARVVLTALSGGITLEGGSTISTIGEATLPVDSRSFGPLSNHGASVLDVGNGYLVYSSGNSQDTDFGPITVADGAHIYSDGSIAFSTSAAVSIGVNASYGGKYLDLAVPEINVGDPAAVGATAPAGLLLTQAVLQTLTQGIPAANVPAVQILDLTASDSLNFYGTAALDLSGSGVELEINTPAIYGYGTSSDVATIGASTIVWNGIAILGGDISSANANTLVSANPGGTVDGTIPGTAIGTLDLNAQNIILGFSSLDVPQNDVTLTRETLGFSNVNLNATSAITANNQGTLAVYEMAPQTYGQAGSGGTLNLNTPLLTAASGATIGYSAGGDINIGSGAGAAALASEAAGGEIDLNAQNVTIASSVILPSGKLDIQAQGDIDLLAGSRVSLAGTTTQNVDQTIFGYGGVLILDSANGDITQNAGSVIDVSAVNNSAGSVSVAATSSGAGQVALDGTLNGSSTGSLATSYHGGDFTVSAQNLGDFAALNTALDNGGFTDSRSFDIKQGDLTIGDGMRAQNVSVSLDNGSLTVTGLIDAAFNGGGSISLAASGNLNLAGSAMLDAHGTTLITDSNGAPIDAENAPQVSLTASNGELTLDDGASIDLASADSTARGDLELNVSRLNSAISGDADIQAGNVRITGAKSIAVNAFWTYNGEADPNGNVDGNPDALITQAYLDQINTNDTMPYMTAAATDADLAARLAGLTGAYSNILHFRPGIAIVSATPGGDLTVNGDLDLAGYRYSDASGYGLQAGSQYGSGEPGVLEIRASGNLNIYGSITDGFGHPVSDAGTEFANGWVIYGGEPYGQNQTVPTAIGIQANSEISDNATVNYALDITGGTFQQNAIAPVALTLTQDVTTTIAFVATSTITEPGGSTIAAGTEVPAGTVIPANSTVAAGGSFPFSVEVGPVTWPKNTPFTVTTALDDGSTGVIVADDMTLAAGAIVPGGSSLIFQNGDAGLSKGNDGQAASVDTRPVGADGTQGALYGLASLLPTGELSWSMNLVSGADTKAADPDIVQSQAALANEATAGEITLADTHYGVTKSGVTAAYSVIRTGTGALQLVSGGSINEDSSYGIYTAGYQSPAVTNAAGQNDYDQPQGNAAGGTSVLGPNNAALAAALAAAYVADYPTDGGNVKISAQGDLNGFIITGLDAGSTSVNAAAITDNDAIGGWLWQQGGGELNGDALDSAWWIEYGSMTLVGQVFDNTPYTLQYTGFQGMGTLGGGNLTVDVGHNASGLDLVVASNGRVTSSDTEVVDGGGSLNVNIGGAVNFTEAGAPSNFSGDEGGLVSDMRGAADISAGSIGTISPIYGQAAGSDPRFISPFVSEQATLQGGIDLAPGDSTVTVDSRGDLVIDKAVNPGAVLNYVNTVNVQTTENGTATSALGATDFSLWTADTAIGLFSAGGGVAPEAGNSGSPEDNSGQQQYYPATMLATAQNGNIYFGTQSVELLPSTNGQLELLAAGSIIGSSSQVSMSGAALDSVATPYNPGITFYTKSLTFSNHTNTYPAPLDFGTDVATSALHAGDTQPARIYAATGDIVDIQFGETVAANTTENLAEAFLAAKPFEIFAGRDIVNSGSIDSPDVILNLAGNDISTITAGRDIIESSFDIAGPGQLVVQAGRNYEALDQGVIDSVGPIFDINPSNRDSGAAVSLLVGTGAEGPDYAAFAEQFLDPASTLGIVGAADIIAGDDQTLATWLQQNDGYTGDASGAYAFFLTLGSAQRDVFLRQLYFQELNQSGLDFNDPTGPRYKSYILGRTAIADLFPSKDANGNAIAYGGDISMSGASGVHTDFGGNIEVLAPGGAATVGVEGNTPPASAGIITQGNGDIDIYSLGSVELGESRVMTTFGGNILIWSAQGDINAGRGSKTTVDYAPVQLVYDNYGDVFLSPTVPSAGAGIATLAPIPSIPAGNINLVAPLGVVDAGEGGIRGSGNLNIAALAVLNAANIQVQGASTGVPTVSTPNVGALTSAAGAAGAAVQAAESTTKTPHATALPSIWIVEILGYGNGPAEPPPRRKKSAPTI